MRRTELGHSGTTVSALGLGTAGMTADPDTPDAADAVAAMHAAFDLGMDFIDTADLYGVGRSESVVGKFLTQTSRTRITLATKFGSMPGGSDGVGTSGRGVNNHPSYIPQACDASLRRLGTDVIDLWYMHRRDPAVPIADSVGAMSRLVEAGKIRWIGLSEVAPATLREAHHVHPITALQSEYSLWMRDPETTVLPVCHELGITFVPFSPLGRGFLTGALDVSTIPPTDFRARLPRFQPDIAAKNQALVGALADFASARHATAGQIALAWLLARGKTGPSIIPIPGTSRPRYLTENAAAAAIDLTEQDMATLEKLFAPDAVAGDRYPPEEAVRAGT